MPAANTAAWRSALGLDREVPTAGLPDLERHIPTPRSTRPLHGVNNDVWQRAMAANRDSSSLPQLRAGRSRETVDIDKLREWLLSDSLDWDAVERARDEGWR
jgi:hypothetical protein